VLDERKARLDAEIASLERERTGLANQIEAETLGEEQIASLRAFAEATAGKLAEMSDDFETKQRLVENLDVRIILKAEEGRHYIHISCLLGDDNWEVSRNSGETRSQSARPGTACRGHAILDVKPGP
jgi:hypothetical protein